MNPWRCPACGVWNAPHVSNHRCDPPAMGVGSTNDPVPVTTPGVTFSPTPTMCMKCGGWLESGKVHFCVSSAFGSASAKVSFGDGTSVTWPVRAWERNYRGDGSLENIYIRL